MEQYGFIVSEYVNILDEIPLNLVWIKKIYFDPNPNDRETNRVYIDKADRLKETEST